MKIDTSQFTMDTKASENPMYLDREETRLLDKLKLLQIEYQKEFGVLEDLKQEVIRIKSTIKNKTKILGPEFSKWYNHQVDLLRQRDQVALNQ